MIMPLRVLIAYLLIAFVVAGVVAAYLHLTRERRFYDRAIRRYRRASKAARRRSNAH